MSNPLVSCLCCTYGRPTLLGEAVKCFLDQDYDRIQPVTQRYSLRFYFFSDWSSVDSETFKIILVC